MIKGYTYGTGTYFYLSQRSVPEIPVIADGIDSMGIIRIPGVEQDYLVIGISDEICNNFETNFHGKGWMYVTVGYVPEDQNKHAEILTGTYAGYVHGGELTSAYILFTVTRRAATCVEDQTLREWETRINHPSTQCKGE